MEYTPFFKYSDEGCEGEGFYMYVVHAIECSSLKNGDEIPWGK